MNHRINVNDLQFSDALSDHKLTDVTGVGENTIGAFVDKTGAGSFATNLTNHSVRGTDPAEDGGTKGFFRGNARVRSRSRSAAGSRAGRARWRAPSSIRSR